MHLNDFVERIPHARGWVEARRLTRGCSIDEKYKVVDSSGNSFCLRVTPTAHKENRRRIFDSAALVSRTGMPMPVPIAFGDSADGSFVYALYTWLEGRDADTTIGYMPLAAQYMFGRSIGEIQWNIHSVRAPDGAPDWRDVMERRIEGTLAWYRESGISIPGEIAILARLEEGMALLDSRP